MENIQISQGLYLPDNWYKSAKKKRIVFSEIEKIGKYMNQNDYNKY